ARARVARKLAELLRRRGLGDDAIAVLEPARDAARGAGLRAAEASCELELARVKMYLADYDAAEAHVAAGFALLDAGAPSERRALPLQVRANIAPSRGDTRAALRDVDDALAQGVASEALAASLHVSRARALVHHREPARAIDDLDRAMTTWRRLGRAEME